jgi:hypothetical protein
MDETDRKSKEEMKRLLFLIVVIMGVVRISAQPFPLDYSFAGYRMSEQSIPDAPVKVFVPFHPGDNYQRIQRALDFVSSLKMNGKTGLRGAVLLDRGRFEISQPLRISASGVVLRGVDRTRTVILKKGYARGAIVYVEGKNDLHIEDTLRIISSKVPLNSCTLSVNGRLAPGDEILVYRPSTQRWINALGCSSFGGGKQLSYWGWHPGEIDLYWDRSVKAVKGNLITMDAPLSMALDADDAHSEVLKFSWKGRINNSGVEHLTLQSDVDPERPKDEDHAWQGVYLAQAKDCWVRQVIFRHLAGSAVDIQRTGSQITVEDCQSYQPVSEIGGLRRRTFFTLGEKCLFQRCYSEEGINDFSAGFCAAGPNAFVQCDSKGSLGFSGSVSSWATGLLFDNVNIDGNDIKFTNLGLEKYGAGWNTANSLIYQSTASGIWADSIPTGGNNYVYGCWGEFNGNGHFGECNNHVNPWSIFEYMLGKRLNKDVSVQCRTLVRDVNEATSPTIQQAQVMSAQAHRPRLTMEMWIDSAKFTASVSPYHVRVVDRIATPRQTTQNGKYQYAVAGGKLVMNGQLLVGGRHDTPWWNGRTRYPSIQKATYALTRFVPGQEGQGVTDRIDSVITCMQKEKMLVFKQNYGLWYDRRRDDHERVRRRDGEVWAPFYEQPFARSGKGTAWDGLSQYDLTRPNNWYFYRLKSFAQKGMSKGLLLLNEHYFQHNILEAGAHWVDCPWRTANNINHTSFPEPVPFTGDKRIFMASYFYNIKDPVLRSLHKAYIEHMLDAFADQPNVIHSIGEEFTGPYDFVKFWLETIKEWEQKKNRKVLVSLAVNKDVQDSVLHHPELSSVVNIITIEQWFYNSKGLYAPDGGQNMSPRQYLRKIKTGVARFEDVYRSVLEYRKAYPDKAVIYYAQKFPELAWASLMAGGSCPDIPVTNSAFLKDVATMSPCCSEKNIYQMKNIAGDRLVYIDGSHLAKISLEGGTYRLYQVNIKTGVVLRRSRIHLSVSNPVLCLKESGVFWLRKIQ